MKADNNNPGWNQSEAEVAAEESAAVTGDAATAATEAGTEPCANAESEAETECVINCPDEGMEPDAEESTLLDELAAEREKYVRLYAEYENFRKRSKKERESVYTEVRADTILRFLPVYDNLSRALALETSDDVYRKGVEMTMAQMEEILDKMGVTVIQALGERFDPELHNAVMHVEDPEKGEGEIVEEFEKGFILGDKVIRFSMVKVAN